MKFEIQFNDTVNNAYKIIREAQHMNVHAETKSWITKVGDYLDDLNFKIDFIEDIDKEDWLHANLLNLLDQLLCTNICFACGSKNENLQLSDRTFVCPVCGATEDRDIHTAKNMLEFYHIQ